MLCINLPGPIFLSTNWSDFASAVQNSRPLWSQPSLWRPLQTLTALTLLPISSTYLTTSCLILCFIKWYRSLIAPRDTIFETAILVWLIIKIDQSECCVSQTVPSSTCPNPCIILWLIILLLPRKKYTFSWNEWRRVLPTLLYLGWTPDSSFRLLCALGRLRWQLKYS